MGLSLQVQLEPVMQLFVTLDRAAQGRVQGECRARRAGPPSEAPRGPRLPAPCPFPTLCCPSGLCGNFNGLEGDDFRTAGGLVEATGAGFANTWKAQASCQDKLDWLDDPCSLNIESGEARPRGACGGGGAGAGRRPAHLLLLPRGCWTVAHGGCPPGDPAKGPGLLLRRWWRPSSPTRPGEVAGGEAVGAPPSEGRGLALEGGKRTTRQRGSGDESEGPPLLRS